MVLQLCYSSKLVLFVCLFSGTAKSLEIVMEPFQYFIWKQFWKKDINIENNTVTFQCIFFDLKEECSFKIYSLKYSLLYI